jgi:hypothetical protein
MGAGLAIRLLSAGFTLRETFLFFRPAVFSGAQSADQASSGRPAGLRLMLIPL